MFSRLLYNRLRPILDREQAADQVGFRQGKSVDDAFIVLEAVCSKCLEWNLPVWCMSLDLSKAFDRIEFLPLFQALRDQGVSDEYAGMLMAIYSHQQGRLRRSKPFCIQRGVKQGDVLSPLLFNAGLEAAIRAWKAKLVDMGIKIDDGERLTNIRYADDLVIYATSSEELVWMTQMLQDELAKVGLHLNSAKSKAFTNDTSDVVSHLNIYSEQVEVLGGDGCHRYLGRKVAGNLRNRTEIEFAHRVQMAWGQFHKHRDIFLDGNLHVGSRLRFFQSVVSPTVLFGLPACALSAKHAEKLDALQRKMFRAIVGWTRHGQEPWEDTMRRMRQKVDRALCLHPVPIWSAQLYRRQFRMACRFSSQGLDWPMRVSQWQPLLTDASAYRCRGRPAVRCEDRLNLFAHSQLGAQTWQLASQSRNFPEHEEAFVEFMCQ